MTTIKNTFISSILALHTVGEQRNVALNKNAYQINTHNDAVASRAVDGSHETDFAGLSCTHITPTNKPWWYVDLGHEYLVERVSLTNRNTYGRHMALRISHLP